jgi:isoaspartyl peptidase/L-asparaginase-like protein (Ntn-hydrolase superfamily)
VFTRQGTHELEASVMTASPPLTPPSSESLPRSRRGAAVTLIKHVRNPILLAKKLYESPEKNPHVLLSGNDAERLAKEFGLEIVDEHWFDTKCVGPLSITDFQL